jgi:hypothetical protein
MIPSIGQILTCARCERQYAFKLKAQRSGATSTRCASCRVNTRRFIKTDKLIELYGGKCTYCGTADSLHFHHIDPDTKSFSISGSHSRSFYSLLQEANKCLLLCISCHAGHHNNTISVDVTKRVILDVTQEQAKLMDPSWEVKLPRFRINLYHRPRPTKIKWPSPDVIKEMVWKIPTETIGQNLGISGKAVEKFCKKHGISKPPRGYWAKQ